MYYAAIPKQSPSVLLCLSRVWPLQTGQLWLFLLRFRNTLCEWGFDVDRWHRFGLIEQLVDSHSDWWSCSLWCRKGQSWVSAPVPHTITSSQAHLLCLVCTCDRLPTPYSLWLIQRWPCIATQAERSARGQPLGRWPLQPWGTGWGKLCRPSAGWSKLRCYIWSKIAWTVIRSDFWICGLHLLGQKPYQQSMLIALSNLLGWGVTFGKRL